MRSKQLAKLAKEKLLPSSFGIMPSLYSNDGRLESGRAINTDPLLNVASLRGYEGVIKHLLDAGVDMLVNGFYGTPYENVLVSYSTIDNASHPRLSCGKVITLLRDRGAREPRKDCHYGVQWNGSSGGVC